MSKSAIGGGDFGVLAVVDHEVDAGNGLTYFCDAAGHQWTCLPNGTMSWSATLSPNGAYQQWQKSVDGHTAVCNPGGGQAFVTSYLAAVPNS